MFKIRILLIVSFAVAFLFFGNYVLKVSAETKTAGPLIISYPGAGPLFLANNIAPGYSETKTLTITNTGSSSHSFGIAVSGTLGELAEVIHLVPRVLGVPIWDKTITEIATAPDSNTIIGSIAPGGTATVDLMAYLPEGVGNDYQNKTTFAFSFVVGNEESEPDASILPAPSPLPSGTGSGAVLAQKLGQALGISTLSPSESISPSPSSAGEVQGEENEGDEETNAASKYRFLYWLIPILIILIILFFLWRRRRSEDEEEEVL